MVNGWEDGCNALLPYCKYLYVIGIDSSTLIWLVGYMCTINEETDMIRYTVEFSVEMCES